MERIKRIVFFGFFIVGFVGVIASANRTGHENSGDPSGIVSLIKDVRLAQEINQINRGQWNSEKEDLNSQTLTSIEGLFNNKESPIKTVSQ